MPRTATLLPKLSMSGRMPKRNSWDSPRSKACNPPWLTRVAKNYLNERELKVLNNLVSAFVDLAELDAIEHRALSMRDYVERLDDMFSAAGRKILEDAGSRSHKEAMKKAEAEYRKYQVRTLTPVEQAYLKSLKETAKRLPKG